MSKRELPENYESFLKEYRKLCKKYRLMVLSDGEPVIIGKYENELWRLRESTIRDLKDKV